MTLHLRSALFAAALAIPSFGLSAAIARDTPRSDPATAASVIPDDKQTCRSIRPTGSRISQRVCRKRSEWEQSAREAREALDDHLNKRDAWQPRQQ